MAGSKRNPWAGGNTKNINKIASSAGLNFAQRSGLGFAQGMTSRVGRGLAQGLGVGIGVGLLKHGMSSALSSKKDILRIDAIGITTYGDINKNGGINLYKTNLVGKKLKVNDNYDQLTNLQELYLHENQLTQLPGKCIWEMASLQKKRRPRLF
jgi:Leucine-rich repeat (LRR) protein